MPLELVVTSKIKNMTSQQQLHQLVGKESEMEEAWQVAVDKTEQEIRTYNDKQTDKLNTLRADADLESEIGILVSGLENKQQSLVKKHQVDLKKFLIDLDDKFRQRQLPVAKKMLENFKNKYIN